MPNNRPVNGSNKIGSRISSLRMFTLIPREILFQIIVNRYNQWCQMTINRCHTIYNPPKINIQKIQGYVCIDALIGKRANRFGIGLCDTGRDKNRREL